MIPEQLPFATAVPTDFDLKALLEKDRRRDLTPEELRRPLKGFVPTFRCPSSLKGFDGKN